MRNGETTLRHVMQPIQRFLDDPAITEVVINRPGEVGIERNGKWSWFTVPEFDFRRLDALGLLSAHLLSKRFSPFDPVCMTTLPDGQRCTLIRPAATEPGKISVTIRIPSNTVHEVWDDDFGDLMGAASRPRPKLTDADRQLVELYHAKRWPEFFDLAVRSRKTIGATGNTGSGKTSVLKRLLRLIPDHERVITVEDTDEFGDMPHRNRVKLFFGSETVSATKAFEACLRMRPDRVLMQELRGIEAMAYVRLLAAGHPGGLTTWHADADDPFTPLVLMVKANGGADGVPDDKLEAIFRRFIDIIVYCQRDETGFSVPKVYFKAAKDLAQ